LNEKKKSIPDLPGAFRERKKESEGCSLHEEDGIGSADAERLKKRHLNRQGVFFGGYLLPQGAAHAKMTSSKEAWTI